MIYRVEYLRPQDTRWTLAADGNDQGMMINSARSVARERRRDKVRLVDANGSVLWMS
jgi:hypothetical protein